MILVLNKIDLVPSHVTLAWKFYFEEKYPNIRVILFTSYPSYNLRMSAGGSSTGWLLIIIIIYHSIVYIIDKFSYMHAYQFFLHVSKNSRPRIASAQTW